MLTYVPLGDEAPSKGVPYVMIVRCEMCEGTTEVDFLDSLSQEDRFRNARKFLVDKGWACNPLRDVCPNCISKGTPISADYVHKVAHLVGMPLILTKTTCCDRPLDSLPPEDSLTTEDNRVFCPEESR